MQKMIVEYSLPYAHVVQVGITAQSHEEAIQKAEDLFNEGSIWDDTPDVPLLIDQYEEIGNAGVPLQFEVVEEVDAWPSKGWEVTRSELHRIAVDLCRNLAEADPEKLAESPDVLSELILQAKRVAGGLLPDRHTKVVICVAGGVVQSVTSNHPVQYVTMDFDTDSATEPDEIVQVTMENGEREKVWEFFDPMPSGINATWVSSIHQHAHVIG